MKITNNNSEEQVHILDNMTNVWSIIKQLSTRPHEEAFYVCDVGDIVRKHKMWMAAMPRVKPHYAVKCNDSPQVLEVLNFLGTGFDCASKNEIKKVMKMGVEPSRIIYAQPAKPGSHIRHAAAVGVETMTFDNQSELYKIKELFPTARLVIRIRCDAAAQCQLGMKFGCDATTEAPELLLLAKSLGLNVVGVSFHVGSGCREPEGFARAIASAKNVFEIATNIGYDFKLLDIGGGFPGDHGTSLDAIADIVNESLDTYFPNPEIEIIAEPGRFYVSSAYTLACNIHSIRTVIRMDQNTGLPKKHHMYYINDGVYGSFNCVLYDHQVARPVPLQEYVSTKQYSSSIWGPTCDGLDQVCEDEMLPEMNLGDWLIFENMGAYTLPVASAFNGFPVPGVHYAVDESMWFLLKDILLNSFDDTENKNENIPSEAIHCKKECVFDPMIQAEIFNQVMLDFAEKLQ